MRRSAWEVAKAVVAGFSEDRAASRGAAIAYYTTFSLAPLLWLVIAIAGLVFGREAATGALFGEIEGLLGPNGASLVEELVRGAADQGSGILSAVLSILLLTITATTVLAELQDALNVIWQARPGQSSGWWRWLKTRLLSLSLIGAIGFLLLVSLVANAALTAIGRSILGGDKTILMQAVTFLVSFAVLTVLFALIYKILPERHLAWRHIWVGATVTGILFAIGRQAIGIYLGTSHVLSSFGAAGTLVLVLLWVYYSAQIFLLGAEFTKALALPARGKNTGRSTDLPDSAPHRSGA
jgi:membrane protein